MIPDFLEIHHHNSQLERDSGLVISKDPRISGDSGLDVIWTIGQATIYLSGEFSLQQIEQIVEMMKTEKAS